MLNDSRIRKSPKEIVSDYAIAYGIKEIDPFFCIYSVQTLDFDSMKSTMSVITNPKDESENIPKNVLEEVMKISFKAFFSYHTKTQCFDWFKDDYCFTHYPAHLEHGGTAQVEVLFESIRKGVFLLKGKLSSITDSASSTYTQTLVVGEGRIHMLKMNPPTGILDNGNVAVMDNEREDSEETDPSSDDRQEIGEPNDRTIGSDAADVPLQFSENEIGEILRETPRECPPEEDAPDDISMQSGSSESSDWNNPENPFLEDDISTVPVRNTDHSEKSSSGESSSHELSMTSTVSMQSARSSLSESSVTLETTMNTVEGHCSNVPADVTEMIPRITTVTVKLVPGKTCGVVLNDSLDVVRVENDALCESAIQVGDRVLSVNRSQCHSRNDFYSMLYASGDSVELCVKREEKTESELADLLKDDGDKLGSLKTREGFTYSVTRTRTDKKDTVFGLTVTQYNNRVLVSDLLDDSICAEFLEKGDHICDIDRIPVTNQIEFQRIIEHKLMTQQIVSLLIERPTSDEARKWISDGLNQEKSNIRIIAEVSIGKDHWIGEDGQIVMKKPMVELWNPKLSNLVDENSSEETIFSEVVSTMFPTVHTEDLARDEAIINQTRRNQRKPWKSTKQISQSILKAPGVVEDELTQLSMNENYEFTFVNVNRKAAVDSENALTVLLESTGIEGKHELSSYARLPIKGYCHIIHFSVWSPIDAKKLYRLVGSEKLWHKVFAEGVLNGAAAFVWTRVTTEQVLNAALATTIKSFNIEYELSEKITQIDGKQLKRDLSNSRSYKNIMIALKNMFWKTHIDKLAKTV